MTVNVLRAGSLAHGGCGQCLIPQCAIPYFLSGAIIARGRVCSGQEVGDKARQTKISDAGLHC